MKGGKTPLGYTIVEVMVVLAVSGFMFLIAAQFINGRQARTAFTQGANDFSNKLQSIAGQVSDGQFTDIDLQTCNVNPGGVSFSTSPVDTHVQGQNISCVFLGKILYFHRSGTTFPERYSLFNIAGAMTNPNTHNPITELTPVTAVFTAVVPGITTEQPVSQSLDVTQMRITDKGGGVHSSNYSIGFLQGLGTASGAAAGDNQATYSSGSQTISMVYGTQMTDNNLSAADAVTHLSGHIDYASKAELCLKDGTHRAIVTVDLAQNGLNVNLRNLSNGGDPCWP